MSSPEEKIQAIKHAVAIAEKEVLKLETLKSVSYLCKEDQYKLDMAKECVRRGKEIIGGTL